MVVILENALFPRIAVGHERRETDPKLGRPAPLTLVFGHLERYLTQKVKPRQFLHAFATKTMLLGVSYQLSTVSPAEATTASIFPMRNKFLHRARYRTSIVGGSHKATATPSSYNLTLN